MHISRWPKFISPYMPLFLLMLFAVSLTNCDTGAQFDGKDDDSSEQAKDEPLVTEREGDELGESDAISVPVEVTGAFLTCSDSLPDKKSDHTYGCGIYTNEKKLEVDTSSFSWKALGQDLSEIPLRVLPMVPGTESPWHIVFETNVKVMDVIVSIPEPQSKDPIEDGQARSTILKWSTFVEPEGEKPNTETSIATSFHIGDNKNYQASCKEGIESVTHFGKSVKFKMVLEQSANVFFRMEGICGIDSYYKNSIKLLSENGVVVQSNFLNAQRRSESGYNIKFSKFVEAGTYYLEIATKFYNNNYDDFVVKNLVMESSSKVDFTRVEH